MWRLTAPLLALAVLAAHFFRAGSISLVTGCLTLTHSGQPRERLPT
jgi:hypothetical protein